PPAAHRAEPASGGSAPRAPAEDDRLDAGHRSGRARRAQAAVRAGRRRRMDPVPRLRHRARAANLLGDSDSCAARRGDERGVVDGLLTLRLLHRYIPGVSTSPLPKGIFTSIVASRVLFARQRDGVVASFGMEAAAWKRTTARKRPCSTSRR